MNSANTFFRVVIYGTLACFAIGTYNQIREYNNVFEIRTPEPPRLTIVPKSGKWKHVNEAIELARPGDCVQIPAGTWRWTNSITVKSGMLIQGATNAQTKIILSSDNAFVVTGSNNIISDFCFTNDGK